MLLVAAMLLSLGQTSPNKQSKQIEQEAKFMLGIVPIVAASVLSGLGSTLCQWAGQVKPFPLFDKQLLSSWAKQCWTPFYWSLCRWSAGAHTWWQWRCLYLAAYACWLACFGLQMAKASNTMASFMAGLHWHMYVHCQSFCCVSCNPSVSLTSQHTWWRDLG